MFFFTPLPGFFSPFPHGTVSLSVIQQYLALRGCPRGFTRDFTCPMLLWIQLYFKGFRLQDFHFLWCSIPTTSSNPVIFLCCSTTPSLLKRVQAISVSLAATKKIDFSFSSSRYLDVSVPWVYLHKAMYSLYDTWGFPCEFPHSEIFGSLTMCVYPKLIAAYRVLHRLLMPRHSPYALCSLTLFKLVTLQYIAIHTKFIVSKFVI